jgi:pimeloyl-ACP methyl ester carboxylesterase
MHVRPFEIRVDDATLRDLEARLATARLPADAATDWEAGTSPAYLRELVAYWRTGFDWRAREADLGRFAHFSTTLDGARVHFIHERGRGEAPLPLVLTHGYPDSFCRYQKLIPLLVDPASSGGDPRDAFDVVVPSLPGFAFSAPLEGPGGIFRVADLWHALMSGLGYRRYGAHGGDWGSTVTEHLGRSHGDAVVGVHLTDVPFWHAFQKPHRRSAAEDDYLAAIDGFQKKEGAYAMIQGTRPQTLADGLTDSPAGLAAWMVQFYQRWSDCDGDVERAFTKDELLTNIMIYWTSGTIASSFEPYYDLVHAGAGRWTVEMAKQLVGTKVPAGFAMFPKDLSHPPREWAERFFDVERWTEMRRGGHFGAMEEPAALADEIRAFFRPLRGGGYG